MLERTPIKPLTRTQSEIFGLDAINRGLYIFPITALSKDPPLIGDNLNSATNDPKRVGEWAAKWRCNWGVSIRKSGLLPLDIDSGFKKGRQHVGDQTYAALMAEHEPDFDLAFDVEPTLAICTPSGGRHLYYKATPAARWCFDNQGATFGKDIDVPNYLLWAGSVVRTESGELRQYEIIIDKPIADAPAWFGPIMDKKHNRPRKPRSAYTDVPIPLDKFKAMLDATPYKGGPAGMDDRSKQGGWFEFMCAVHEAACGDNADYLHAFLGWCHGDKSGNWPDETIIPRWESLSEDDENKIVITRASWFKLLKHLGRKEFMGTTAEEALIEETRRARRRARELVDTTLPPLLKPTEPRR